MYKKKFGMHIASFIFKAVCAIVIIAVLGIFVWRIATSGNPKSMKEIIPNDVLCSVYSEKGDLTVFTQKQDTITRADNNSGYFSVTEAKFYEEAEQVQLVFRYNNSTLEHLMEDYGMSEVPSRDGDWYDVTITVAYDLTPNDTSDNASNKPESVRFERIRATGESKAEQKNLYNYRKFVFDGVRTDETVLAIYVDIYYNEDINYDEEAYGTLIIYDYKKKKNYSDLSRADKKILDAYVG